MTYREYVELEFNYKCITTFWEDFSIADRFGISAIRDTFRRAFRSWRKHYKYLTELVLVLNHKCCYYYGRGRRDIAQVYSQLFDKAREYALDHLEGEEFKYFYNITD